MIRVRALLLKSWLGRERREGVQLAGWVGVSGEGGEDVRASSETLEPAT